MNITEYLNILPFMDKVLAVILYNIIDQNKRVNNYLVSLLMLSFIIWIYKLFIKVIREKICQLKKRVLLYLQTCYGDMLNLLKII